MADKFEYKNDVNLDKRSTGCRMLVAIPCLNEMDTIAEVIARIPRNIPGITQVDALVVDDGSIDGTGDIAALAGAFVVTHMANLGVGAAFQSALEYAVNNDYQVMINIDGDGQFRPEDIPELVEPILAGKADMVTASRFKDPVYIPVMPKVKLIGNHMMSFLISRLVRNRFYDVSCGFRCYSREALLRLNPHSAFTYTQETFLDFASKNLRIVEVPVKVIYFDDRKSRVASSIFKYAANTSKIIFRSYRDYFPLRFFLGLSFIFAFPGLIFGIAFLIHFLYTGKFTGYLFAGFMSGFLIVLSLVFVVIGIVCDMLDRIRSNQERILYLIKKGLYNRIIEE